MVHHSPVITHTTGRRKKIPFKTLNPQKSAVKTKLIRICWRGNSHATGHLRTSRRPLHCSGTAFSSPFIIPPYKSISYEMDYDSDSAHYQGDLYYFFDFPCQKSHGKIQIELVFYKRWLRLFL